MARLAVTSAFDLAELGSELVVLEFDAGVGELGPYAVELPQDVSALGAAERDAVLPVAGAAVSAAGLARLVEAAVRG